MDQTTIFTREEQSGSGQTSMLNLIEKNQARIKELRRTPHTFHTDPGHGWLEVYHQDLIILNIMGTITGFSYRDEDKVYLEEDLDAGTYINALWGDLKGGSEYQLWNSMITDSYKENTFIRNLAGYR